MPSGQGLAGEPAVDLVGGFTALGVSAMARVPINATTRNAMMLSAFFIDQKIAEKN